MRGTKNTLLLVVILLIGVVLGGFIGELAQGVDSLQFLNYGQTFGIGADAPVVLDLWIVTLVFGVSFHLTIGIILGLALALLVWRKIR